MSCDVQDWSMKDLSDALCDRHRNKKRITVPLFQRGTRWNKSQEIAFIDSLKKGYPVGTMLFYETVENNQTTYILVDGLQRGNSIRKYITRPTDYFLETTVSDDFCAKILHGLHLNEDISHKAKVRTCLTQFVREQSSYANLQYYHPAKDILMALGVSELSAVECIMPLLEEYFRARQELYNRIATTKIPVVVYHGDESTLTEIFERINSKGTPLTAYEIYAASWPTESKIKVENKNIIDAVLRKYASFGDEDFALYGYDENAIKKSQELSAFEYLFGLSKYLTTAFDVLAFKRDGEADDETNKLGFELVNACFNSADKISELYEIVLNIADVNAFERALVRAIQFVTTAISPILKFKGNAHGKTKILHSKFQIMSMIAAVFREMYDAGNYEHCADSWKTKKDELAKNILHYYIYDVLYNYWSEGGTGKIFTVLKPNRYLIPIPANAWSVILDSYFSKTMQRAEYKKVANPGSEEYVFLNCIYLKTFSALDQLSASKFDVEHLAPKAQLKGLIECCEGSGLPISSIANLCYLPEYVNRSKGAKTIYKDGNYLKKVHESIADIEAKYSFTTESALEWLDMPFQGKDDFADLKSWYEEFCKTRFATLKTKFLESLGIEWNPNEISFEPGLAHGTDEPTKEARQGKIQGKNRPICEAAMSKFFARNPELAWVKNAYNQCHDNQGNGYCFQVSKAFLRKDGRLYWYSYRKESLVGLEGCKNINFCFICADDGSCIKLAREEIEKHLSELHVSPHGDGTSHWHIKFFRGKDGKIKWLLGPEGNKGKKVEVPLFF